MGLKAAIKEIFSFFFKQELKAKRTKIFFLLSFVPVLILLIAKLIEIINPDTAGTAENVFTKAMLMVYFQLLIPVLALLYGAMVINEEVDNKTLVFLTTSPVPKASVILGKYAAYVLLANIIMNAGLVLCFLIINIDHLGSMSNVDNFFKFLGVGILASITYMALFTLLGTLMKKSIMMGIFFIFGWENVVQYFPGLTQKFTVVHWVKSLLPSVSESGDFLRFLVSQLEPSSAGQSLTVLIILVIGSLVAASYIFQHKEYILSDIA